MSAAPLTTAAFGSTRCPGCEKRFADSTLAVVEMECEEMYTRKGSVSMGEHRTVTRRWHETCLREFEAWNVESARRAADDHERTMRELCKATGVDYDNLLAKQAQR